MRSDTDPDQLPATAATATAPLAVGHCLHVLRLPGMMFVFRAWNKLPRGPESSPGAVPCSCLMFRGIHLETYHATWHASSALPGQHWASYYTPHHCKCSPVCTKAYSCMCTASAWLTVVSACQHTQFDPCLTLAFSCCCCPATAGMQPHVLPVCASL